MKNSEGMKNNHKYESKMASGTTREQKPCPYPSCGLTVLHLPRHLKDVHGWTKEHARTASTRFGMRKKYQFTDKEKAKILKIRQAQRQKTTIIIVIALSKDVRLWSREFHHLKNVHQLKPGSKAYTNALSQVRGPVKESHMAPYHKRPRASPQEVVLIKDYLEERIKQTVRDGDESSVKHPDSIKIWSLAEVSRWREP